MIRYLGSRTCVANHLASCLYRFCHIRQSRDWNVYDICAGSGIISLDLLKKHFNIFPNDIYPYSYIVNSGLFEMGATTGCQKLYNDIYDKPSGFHNDFADRMKGIEDFFNNINGVQGLITDLYTEKFSEKTRYYTVENGMKIDAIRQSIGLFKDKGLIDQYEMNYLLFCLLNAADSVANTKFKYDVALGKEPGPDVLNFKDVTALWRPRLIPFTTKRVTNFDIERVGIGSYENSITILDPPFQKRRDYSTLYGVPNTIALYDNPEVKGLYNARVGDGKSNFSFASTYHIALQNTLKRIPTRYIVLILPSYNYDCLYKLDKVEAILNSLNFKRVEKKVLFRETKPDFCFQWRDKFSKNSSIFAYFIEQ